MRKSDSSLIMAETWFYARKNLKFAFKNRPAGRELASVYKVQSVAFETVKIPSAKLLLFLFYKGC